MKTAVMLMMCLEIGKLCARSSVCTKAEQRKLNEHLGAVFCVHHIDNHEN